MSAQEVLPNTSQRPATPLQQARLATSTVFFVHAVLFASWTPHIPAIKTALGLSDASLGVALLGAPVGSVGAMLAAGALVSRWGSAAVMRVTLVGYTLVPASLGLADSATSLFAALAGWGTFYGSLDVAMNAHAGSIERQYGRSIFASFHACWSVGAFVGTGLGSASVALGIALPWHMLGLGVLIAAVTLPLSRWALPAHTELPVEPTTRGHRLARPTPALIGLGLIVFCGLLCEGAAADWTAVYLRDTFSVAGGLAGLGYAAFAGAMFVGRSTGDRLISRFGPRNAVRAGAMLAGLALAAGLALNHPSTAITGFALLGAGLSLVVPSVFGASTRVPDTPPAPALALTTTFGWVGFLCGPPLIGLLASKFTLPDALGLLTALCLVMTVLASIVPMPFHRQDRKETHYD
jgi:MFS family permease